MSEKESPAGLQSMTLAECGHDAIPWPELKELQHLRQLELP